MKIGDASRATGLTIKAIRHYEAKGLLPKVRRQGTYRNYTSVELGRLELIGHCRSLGFSVIESGTNDGSHQRSRIRTSSTDQVEAFFEAALAAGGVDNGPPGPRPDYGPRYDAAFVLDPDGHNIEAVVGGVG